MGIWGGVDPNTVDIAGTAAEMRPALYAWFNAQVVFYDPKNATATRYVPSTDAGGVTTGATVYDTGVNGCYIDILRAPSRVDLGGQGNEVVAIRIQMKHDGPKLHAGLIVKVVEGGEDDTLPSYTFELQEAIDSSLAWGRILEATVTTGG